MSNISPRLDIQARADLLIRQQLEELKSRDRRAKAEPIPVEPAAPPPFGRRLERLPAAQRTAERAPLPSHPLRIGAITFTTIDPPSRAEVTLQRANRFMRRSIPPMVCLLGLLLFAASLHQ